MGGGSDTVTISHTTGELVLAENLYVDIDGATCPGSGNELALSSATITLVWQNEAGASGTYRTWEAE